MEDAGNSGRVALEPEGAERPSAAERIRAVAGVAVLFALVIAVLAGGVWALVETFPDEVSERPETFLDRIFASRAVLWAARVVMLSAGVVLFFGGIYVVVSIVAWLRRGHLLEQAGPFRVSARAARTVEAIEKQIVEVGQELMQARTDNDELERQLAGRTRELEELKVRANQTVGAEQGGVGSS